MTSKISQKIGFMRRTCKYLTQKHKILVFNSIIGALFTYRLTLLFVLNNSQHAILQKLQNKCMRFILNERYDAPIQNMLQKLNWLNIKQQYCFYTLKFIHSIKLGLSPKYLQDFLIYNNQIHDHHTRNKNNIRLPICHRESEKSSLNYKGMKLYNELPENLKNCKNINLFKIELKNYCKTL